MPAEFETVPVGAEVTLAILDPQEAALTDLVGPGAERVDGRLLRRNGDELVLSVAAVQYLDIREPVAWPTRDPVTIPRELVGDVQERKIDRTRSWIAAGVAVLAAVIASTVPMRGGGSENGDNEPDVDDPTEQ